MPSKQPKSYANPEVLSFYQELPFNQRSDASHHIETIKRNPIKNWPVIIKHLKKNKTVLDVGCGVGWLSSSVAYHYKCNVTGIDFNSVAIERAEEISGSLNLDVQFQVHDLFTYMPEMLYDVVISMGVLHHTDNCIAAVEHVFKNLLKPGGYALIGLYHSYGRKPFLDHFETMRNQQASEEDLYNEYKRLHSELAGDETHLLSWFRDQVLIPHETQHTVSELLPVMEKHKVKLVSSSINHFKSFSTTREITELEPKLELIGRERLEAGKYWPGFFVVLVHKDPDSSASSFVKGLFDFLPNR